MLRCVRTASRRRCARSVARLASPQTRALSQHAPEDASLWERMGGEPVIRPLVAGIYGLHKTDPLTAPWFGGRKFGNTGNDDYVIERVFTFFSAGIGGPHEYEGEDMIAKHAGMQINGPAFHAVAYHVISKMEEHGAGGHREREEVLDILNSLKDDVMARTQEAQPPAGSGDKYIVHDPRQE